MAAELQPRYFLLKIEAHLGEIGDFGRRPGRGLGGVGVVLLAALAFAVWTQRTALTDCADAVRENYERAGTDVTLTLRRKGEVLDVTLTRALIEILYATGLRVSELVGLPLSALARNNRVVIVRGKGCRVWDADGREYIDAMASLWYANIGYYCDDEQRKTTVINLTMETLATQSWPFSKPKTTTSCGRISKP